MHEIIFRNVVTNLQLATQTITYSFSPAKLITFNILRSKYDIVNTIFLEEWFSFILNLQILIKTMV